MKKFIIPVIFALLLSCTEKPVESIPDDVLSVQKMTAIMVDVQLIEGGINIMKYNKTQRKDQIADYYRALFLKHEVSKEDFEYSLKYYTDHPGKLEDVYDGMLDALSKLQAEVENEKPDSASTE